MPKLNFKIFDLQTEETIALISIVDNKDLICQIDKVCGDYYKEDCFAHRVSLKRILTYLIQYPFASFEVETVVNGEQGKREIGIIGT